jgi:hypothetical protein
MLLVIDSYSYAAAMAALEVAIPLAAPDIKPHFIQAIADLRSARNHWLKTDIETVPALLRRQAE